MKTSHIPNRIAPKALLGIAAGLVIAIGLLVPGRAGATTTSDPETFGESMNRVINCGLWFGASFDIVNGMKCSTLATGPQQKPPQPPPQPPPQQEPQPQPEPQTLPETGSPTGGTYVALGDSVPAGLGLGKVQGGVNSQCGQSGRGYPVIVASRMGLPLTNVSCSGATAGDLITEQSVSGPNIPAQLDSAFQNGTPALMTITAGANDVHWAEFIGGCFTTDCTGLAFRSAAEAYIATLRVKLHTALAQINTRSSGSPPPVIVTGYYQAISMACTGQQQNITSEEIAWLNSMTDSLNRTIQSVGANYSYVQFVPISFSGHDMCSADPWVQGTDSPAPFHPTARGQQIIAQSILAKANN